MIHAKNRNLKPTAVAIYCPLWHRYDHMDSWKGQGWNEWELLKTAPPRFRGHYQPLRPTWGCFDESDPRWSEREIALAANHGVDVFLFDWYWYSGVKIMEEALERGFLKARNRRRLRFALMWANHDWNDYFPAPYGRPREEWNMWLPMRHSPRDLDRVIDYCIEHYFRQPNYWRLDGKLFFSIYAPKLFIEQLGGPSRTCRLLRKVNARLTSRGLPPIHWNTMTRHAKDVPMFRAAGFQSTTSYNIIRSGKLRPSDNPIDQYTDLMETHRCDWQAMSRTTLPHMPVVTLGWDVTPRTEHSAKWPFHPKKRCYPYTHVVVGNTPARFGKLCRDAREHLEKTKAQHLVVFVNAWNEWTEGCYLLPEKRYGTGYLKALKKAL
jgi:hypothetical protein